MSPMSPKSPISPMSPMSLMSLMSLMSIRSIMSIRSLMSIYGIVEATFHPSSHLVRKEPSDMALVDDFLYLSSSTFYSCQR
jgi:hypothetical protein